MIIFGLVLLGLCAGSFVSAFVWRLHEQATNKKLSKKQRKDLSIVSGRSMCSHCKHTLAWPDLVPVLSWLALQGKCRYCRQKIEDTPLPEILLAGLFVGSYLAWPYGFDIAGIVLFVLWLKFLIAFMVLAVYDLRWMLLPNQVVYPLIGLACLQVVIKMFVSQEVSSVLVGAVSGFVVIGGLFYGLFWISDGKWIGGGDVKLGFMIGPLVGGAVDSLLVIFLASFLGSIIAVPLLLTKSLKASSRIPFGPFLLIGAIVTYLYGSRIADWYIAQFLG